MLGRPDVLRKVGRAYRAPIHRQATDAMTVAPWSVPPPNAPRASLFTSGGLPYTEGTGVICRVDKRRPRANVAEIMNIIGSVDGKRCVLIDDMIDTAGTITLAAQALMDAGAIEVYACATHPVLSGPAIERIEKSPIKQLVVTDSIQLPEEKQIDKLVQVSVGPLIGDAIKRIHENKPVSPLFTNRFRRDQH